MIKNKFLLKKYIPVYRAGDKICVGYVNDLEKYIEIDYTNYNISLVNNLLRDGITKKEIKSIYLYSAFFDSNFLVNSMNENSTNRNCLYLEYLFNEEVDFEKFNKKILIFGAGAGGSVLVFQLAQFGFKNLYIVDDDVVEKSDIFRSFTYSLKDLNLKKVEVLKKIINERFNIKLNISKDMPISREQINKHVELFKPNLIIKACDPKGIFLKNLNSLAFEKKIPYMSIAYSFEYIKIGPLFVPDITSCSVSMSDYNVENFGEHYNLDLFERPFKENLIHPSINFNINLLTSLAFKEILFFCYEKFEYCQVLGRLLIFNPLNFTVRGVNFTCKSNCKICQN